MTLRELIAGAGSARTARADSARALRRCWRSTTASPTAADARRRRGASSSACAASGRWPRLRAGRGRARRGRAGLRAAARARRPELLVEDVRAAMPPLAAGFYRPPDARARAGRRDRHERQDHDRVPGARRSSRRRAGRPDCSEPFSRWSAARSSRSSARRPESIDLQTHVPAHGRRRRSGVRDGGVVARARAAARATRSTSTAPCSRT